MLSRGAQDVQSSHGERDPGAFKMQGDEVVEVVGVFNFNLEATRRY